MKLGNDAPFGRGLWVLLFVLSSFSSCTCESKEMSACLEECGKLEDRKSQCTGPDEKICKKLLAERVEDCEANCKAIHAEGEEGEAPKE